MLKSFAFVLGIILFAACGILPSTLQTKQVSDIDGRKIRRIAVVPSVQVVSALSGAAARSEREAPENLGRFVYSAMVSLPNWQIISDSEVRDVGVKVAPTSEPVRVRMIGEMVYADAVLTGTVQRYRERIGDEWGAKSPASVAFVLNLVDVRRGDVIWTAQFDETQKPLSENIFAMGDIGQRGVRWLSADQLAQEGIKKAIGQLHDILARR
jgi:TolB-like protein